MTVLSNGTRITSASKHQKNIVHSSLFSHFLQMMSGNLLEIWNWGFYLVNDFFSKWNFSKNGLQLLMVRYWFIYICDTKTIKVTFSLQKFNLLVNLTQINSFSCFFWEWLNNSVGFTTPIVKKWRIHITIALLESKWWGDHLVASSYRGMANNTYKYIFWSMFVKLASDFILNIYHLASYFWLEYRKICF